MLKIRNNYEHTIYASYVGYFTQAIVNNLAPLLFLTFASAYDLTLDKITLITTINFLVQLGVDLLSTKVMDKIGYRIAVVAAHIFASAGLVSLAFLPELIGNSYVGIVISVVLYAIGGGIIEVIISPIVEACPTKKKEAAMSLLHSFYCWGQVSVVLGSTLFFHFVGIENWRILACIWAIIPFLNIFYFMLVPLFPIVAEHEKMDLKKLLSQRTFWLLIVIMICAGASELAMSQWASTFAESALKVSKTVGDLAGPCAFGIVMGLARTFYAKNSEKISLKKAMMICAVLCVGCYIAVAFSQNVLIGLIGCAFCGFTIALFWPGTFSIAAMKLPGGGTAMYALMALAGDIGCSSGPTLVGFVAKAANDNLKVGLGVAMIFPILIFIGLSMLKMEKKTEA